MKNGYNATRKVISMVLCILLLMNVLLVPSFSEEPEVPEGGYSRMELMKKLDAMESVFFTTKEGHQFYETLLGSTVQEVLDNRDVIVNQASVDPAVVDKAGNTTEALRILLKEYAGIKTDEGKYQWYSENYEAVTENFTGLYDSLYDLYENYRAVRNYLKDEDKTDRFAQFVSRLYVTAASLDDSRTVSKDWEMKGGYTLENSLEKDFVLSDKNDASPEGCEWPKTEIVKGDVDGKDGIKSEDLTTLARHVAKIEYITGPLLDNADVNSDGAVDATDLTILARYVAKIITEFPEK